MALSLKVIIGSTRPGRQGPIVAHWVEEMADRHEAFDVDLIDLAEVGLPLLDEPEHPARRNYQHEHTKRWSALIEPGDACVFVTPEYDYFPPAALVNAIQCLSLEWRHKPAGVVSYGGVSGGLRSAQMLRSLISSLNMMPLVQTVPVPFFTRHIENGVFKPNEEMNTGLGGMLNELATWATACRTMRAG
jgi:NAD(P)H-dependent FMN reductase